MPEQEILSLDEPYPNVVIDRLRRAVKEQLDDLGDQVERLDDAFLLLLTTTDFAQSTLRTVLAGQAAIGQIQAAVGQLSARVAALETAAKTTTTGGTP